MLNYSFNEMCEFSRTNNSSYNGKFFLAVKTTKIFCIPSCKAKFPLPENVEFYETKEEALNAGYRGCKRCYSANWPFEEPDWLKEIVEYMKSNLLNKITESQLVEKVNVDPTTLRKYFRKKYKTSLMNYYRSLRLEKAKDLLEESSVSEIAYLCGFTSVKGFSKAFEKKFGISPSQEKRKISLKETL